jgi:hypothetical protein
VLFLVGTLCLGVGMIGALFPIGDVLFGLAAGIATLVVTVAIVLVTWYVIPLRRGHDPRIRHEE